jgi:hypothetical protein
MALLERNDFAASVNRAYHAMFHAARGALARRSVENMSRKHGTVVGQLGRQFVAGGILPKSGRTINEVQKASARRRSGGARAGKEPGRTGSGIGSGVRGGDRAAVARMMQPHAARMSSLIGPSPRPWMNCST